jgi:HAMP domain-containing protein
MQSTNRLGLGFFVSGFAVLAILLSLGCILPFLLHLSRDITDRQNGGVLRNRAIVASHRLVRVLHNEWLGLQRIAGFVARGNDPNTLRVQFSAIKSANNHYRWIGFVDPGGKVVVASDGVMEGNRVGELSWFRGGAEGPYAGDKPDFALLSTDGTANPEEVMPLITLAMPVRRENGALTGVVGIQIDWNWVKDFVRSVAQGDDTDLVLVSRDGTVLAGPSSLEGTRPGLRSVSAAARGLSLSSHELWPDGHNYLVTLVPIPSYRDLPSFGWTLIARQRTELAFSPARELVTRMLPIMGIAGALLFGAALLLGRWLGRPITRLASAASDMAAGKFDEPVPEERLYRQSSLLSDALTRLQSTVSSQSGSAVTVPLKPRGTNIA